MNVYVVLKERYGIASIDVVFTNEEACIRYVTENNLKDNGYDYSYSEHALIESN